LIDLEDCIGEDWFAGAGYDRSVTAAAFEIEILLARRVLLNAFFL
jgi:hypothetical protein